MTDKVLCTANGRFFIWRDSHKRPSNERGPGKSDQADVVHASHEHAISAHVCFRLNVLGLSLLNSAHDDGADR